MTLLLFEGTVYVILGDPPFIECYSPIHNMVPFEPISDDKEDVGFVPENMFNSDCFILWDKNSETDSHFEIFFLR